MANLCQVVWTVVVTITISVGATPVLEDDNLKFPLHEDDKFPSTSFVPEKLRMSDAVYDRLLAHLGEQLSAENVDISVNDYFPKEVESDEEDELKFLHEYDLDEDEDDDVDEFVSNLPNDASISTGFGKHEFKFAKVLTISKNGTKRFSKYRQSTKCDGNATSSASGSFNTSLDVTTSASGKFDVNITYYAKGGHNTIVASGTVVSSSASESQVEERRLLQQAASNSTVTLQHPANILIKSSVRSGSETFKLPFRSFLTIFKGQSNITVGNMQKMRFIVAGQANSRVAFANKTVSLTKSCFKAYVKSKSVADGIANDDDSTFDDSADYEDKNAAASTNVFQVKMIRAKIHTWTKVVSQSKTEMVVDVITCTKTRIYGKTVKKGAFVMFTGTGQVSWNKSRATIVAKRLHNLSHHEYGVNFVKKDLESSLIEYSGSQFEMGM